MIVSGLDLSRGECVSQSSELPRRAVQRVLLVPHQDELSYWRLTFSVLDHELLHSLSAFIIAGCSNARRNRSVQNWLTTRTSSRRSVISPLQLCE